MVIKVLGTGCKNCILLENNVREAIKKINSSAEISKVSSVDEIVNYGVMMIPALIIDDEIVSAGKVLSVEKIIAIIKKIELKNN
jgi:small redox-active disulfide protein 2